MDQARALNALAPFLALAKTANSPRAAADLVTQATSAPNTYVFAELLQQPNIQALADNEQYGAYHELLRIFAWGTWASYKATPSLPTLSDPQALKLRLLSLLTIAAQKPTSNSLTSNLSYPTLCAHLDLPSPLELEHLVTTAIYSNLLTATLNPAAQTVVITSVAPLRDLAPGSVGAMMAELAAWSGRCESVLKDLEGEIERVRVEAKRRAGREARAERQVRAVTEAAEKSGGGGGATAGGGGMALGGGGGGARNTRAKVGRELDDADDDGDFMDVDGSMGGSLGGGGRKRSAGGSGGGGGGPIGNFLGKMSGRSGGR